MSTLVGTSVATSSVNHVRWYSLMPSYFQLPSYFHPTSYLPPLVALLTTAATPEVVLIV
jgi:hypothetical protein